MDNRLLRGATDFSPVTSVSLPPKHERPQKPLLGGDCCVEAMRFAVEYCRAGLFDAEDFSDQCDMCEMRDVRCMVTKKEKRR